MLRLTLAFSALVLGLMLVTPTIASVARAVEDLDFRRQLPWELWKWDTKVDDGPAGCTFTPVSSESEITKWPERVRKDEPFDMSGHVIVPSENGRGLAYVPVDIYLNATKRDPGELIGRATTDERGRFTLQGTFPRDMPAQRYHILAHSYERTESCTRYLEHWSDPEMDVTADTNLTLEAPSRAVTGELTLIGGQLLDHVGAPVPHARVDVSVANLRKSVQTDAGGRFEWEFEAGRPAVTEVIARFERTRYYEGSEARAPIEVTGEDVRFVEADERDSIPLIRSQEIELHGEIVLPPRVESREPARVTFPTLHVRTCDTCDTVDFLDVEPSRDGSFDLHFTVPSDIEAGRHPMWVEGGGLSRAFSFNLTIRSPVFVEMEVTGAGALTPAVEGHATFRDDRGEPVTGEAALLIQGEWTVAHIGSDGVAPFMASAACGVRDVRIVLNATGDRLPGATAATALVCPLGWVLHPFGLSWWFIAPALAFLVAGAWFGYTAWRARTPTLSRGPPLKIRLIAAEDLEEGLVGAGDAVEVVVELESVLPAAHTMRVGIAGDMREVTLNGALAATITFVPKDVGKQALRGEILDARGKIITRRTVFLRVVRYAEEIERRYRSLRRAGLGAAAEATSPREFAAWLRQNAGDIEPGVAERLTAIFEEADYGPREIGRRELTSYLRAERNMQGVDRAAGR